MNWPVRPLSEVAEVRLGRQRAPKNHHGDSMRPYLRAANVTWSGLSLHDVKSMNFTDEELVTYRLEPGDIVLSEASGSPGEVGKPAIWSGEIADCAFQNTLIRVRPREHEPRFLLHYFRYQALIGRFVEHSRGVGIHHLGRARLAMWRTPVPPIREQRRIVEILEDQLSRLDAAAEGLLKTRKRIYSLERSALDTHFAKGRLVPLKDLIEDISAGKSFGTSNSPAGEDDWGIIKVSAMTWGRFNPNENKAVSGDRVDPRFEIREGDLLVSRANTADYVGASVLVGPVRPKLLLSDKSLRLTPKAGVNPEWLWRALQAPSARRQITASATGTKDSMRNISQVALRQVLLPKVGEAMQSEALNAFAAVAMSTNRLCTEIDSCRVRLGNLRRSLLVNAFSGRLTGGPELSSPQNKVGA